MATLPLGLECLPNPWLLGGPKMGNGETTPTILEVPTAHCEPQKSHMAK